MPSPTRFLPVAIALLLATGCQTRERTSETSVDSTAIDTTTSLPADTLGGDYAGTWTGTIPAGSGTGRVFTLQLAKNGPAQLRFDHRSAELPVSEAGAWRPLPEGGIELTITTRGGEAITAEVLRFARVANRLHPAAPDPARWGDAPLALTREIVSQDVDAAGSKDIAAVLGRRWMWVRTTTTTEVVASPDPARYTMELDTDGRVAVLADCNRGMGGYTMDGNAITLGPIALTRRGCGPNSLGTRFAGQLDQGRHWALHGDTLTLDLVAGSGTMQFVAAPGSP
jgi:heat shock protein HslJ